MAYPSNCWVTSSTCSATRFVKENRCSVVSCIVSAPAVKKQRSRVSPCRLLDLYLSSAWRLWRGLPAVVAAQSDPTAVVAAGEVMLRAVDDAVANLAEGFQLARRSLVRSQVSARREFVDDLLTGGADVVGLLGRASGFGLHLSGPHAVAVVTAAREFTDDNPLGAGGRTCRPGQQRRC